MAYSVHKQHIIRTHIIFMQYGAIHYLPEKNAELPVCVTSELETVIIWFACSSSTNSSRSSSSSRLLTVIWFASSHSKWGRSNFQGLVTMTLTLDQVIWHAGEYQTHTKFHSNRKKTFCGQTEICTDGRTSRLALLGQLRRQYTKTLP